MCRYKNSMLLAFLTVVTVVIVVVIIIIIIIIIIIMIDIAKSDWSLNCD